MEAKLWSDEQKSHKAMNEGKTAIQAKPSPKSGNTKRRKRQISKTRNTNSGRPGSTTGNNPSTDTDI